jgi:hypothetical protein
MESTVHLQEVPPLFVDNRLRADARGKWTSGALGRLFDANCYQQDPTYKH